MENLKKLDILNSIESLLLNQGENSYILINNSIDHIYTISNDGVAIIDLDGSETKFEGVFKFLNDLIDRNRDKLLQEISEEPDKSLHSEMSIIANYNTILEISEKINSFKSNYKLVVEIFESESL